MAVEPAQIPEQCHAPSDQHDHTVLGMLAGMFKGKGTGKGKGGPVCHFCGKAGHTKRECKSLDKVMEEWRAGKGKGYGKGGNYHGNTVAYNGGKGQWGKGTPGKGQGHGYQQHAVGWPPAAAVGWPAAAAACSGAARDSEGRARGWPSTGSMSCPRPHSTRTPTGPRTRPTTTTPSSTCRLSPRRPSRRRGARVPTPAWHRRRKRSIPTTILTRNTFAAFGSEDVEDQDDYLDEYPFLNVIPLSTTRKRMEKFPKGTVANAQRRQRQQEKEFDAILKQLKDEDAKDQLNALENEPDDTPAFSASHSPQHAGWSRIPCVLDSVAVQSVAPPGMAPGVSVLPSGGPRRARSEDSIT